jgi:hypothetical protein
MGTENIASGEIRSPDPFQLILRFYSLLSRTALEMFLRVTNIQQTYQTHRPLHVKMSLVKLKAHCIIIVFFQVVFSVGFINARFIP